MTERDDEQKVNRKAGKADDSRREKIKSHRLQMRKEDGKRTRERESLCIHIYIYIYMENK